MPTSSASMLCEDCLSIGTQPHENMRHQGTRSIDGGDGAVERQYRCIVCNTVWVARMDKWGSTSGFKLVPTTK